MEQKLNEKKEETRMYKGQQITIQKIKEFPFEFYRGFVGNFCVSESYFKKDVEKDCEKEVERIEKDKKNKKIY